MRESTVEEYLVERVEAMGGFTRKMKWIGHNSAPDRFVSFPFTGVVLVELKRPRKDATAKQAREHARLRAHGVEVVVLNTKKAIDDYLDKGWV
jgi:hypothetical protein